MRAARLLRDWSFSGPVHAVNPVEPSFQGRATVPSLRDLRDVDLALVLVGRTAVIGVLRDAVESGTPAAIVVASGYGESSDEAGHPLEQELAAFARESGLLVAGPNCLGVLNARMRIPAFAGPIDSPVLPGRLGVISQSGGNLCGLLNSAYERHLGLSYAISSGNETCLGFCDYLDHLIDDPDTTVICGFLESITDVDRFRSTAIRAHDAQKPIVAIKVGRSLAGRAAALAHTGALAGPDDLVQTLFDETGVLRADSIDDALDKATLFAQLPKEHWPRGRRVAFFSIGGGAVGIFADLASERRLTFPELPPDPRARLADVFPPTVAIRNPMDIPGWHQRRRPDLLQRTITECLQSDLYDSVVVTLAPYEHLLSAVGAAAEAMNAARKPIVTATFSSFALPKAARDHIDCTSIPVIPGIDRCVRALDACITYQASPVRRWSRRTASAPDGALAILQAALSQQRDTLTTKDAFGLLAAYGLPVARQTLVKTVDEAVRAARQVGYPVALKAADLPHKSDHDAIVLGLHDDSAVRHAMEVLTARLRSQDLDPVLVVQEMVTGQGEVYMGGISGDRAYPPSVLVGVGGIFVEVLGDTAIRSAPVSRDEALRMVSSLRAAKVVLGYRREHPPALEELTATISRFSELVSDLGSDIAEIDVNPVVVGDVSHGVKIVDAIIVLKRGHDAMVEEEA